jgi:predicted site-specific integrase-resolvase
MWVKAKEITSKFKISNTTLCTWVKVGKITRKSILGSKYFLYDASPFEGFAKKHIIYARVSTQKQRNDLDEQVKIIRNYVVANGHIVDQVFTDIASGMNENRIALISLMDLVAEGDVNSVYISYRDRLTRFGFGYLENFCSRYNTKVVVVNLTEEKDFQEELTEDLIAIIHHFSMKMYSNRRKSLKELKNKLLKELENEENKLIFNEKSVINIQE